MSKFFTRPRPTSSLPQLRKKELHTEEIQETAAICQHFYQNFDTKMPESLSLLPHQSGLFSNKE